MRLDHLLSKEHSAGYASTCLRILGSDGLGVGGGCVVGPSGFRGVCSLPGALISGALVIQLVVVAGSVGTAVIMPLTGCGRGVGRRMSGGWGWLGTLLGPEGTGRSPAALCVVGGFSVVFLLGLVSCHTGLGLVLVVACGWLWVVGLGVWWWGGLVSGCCL